MSTSPTPPPALSIVIPCYNEGRGLATLLAQYAESGAGVDFELVAVDNGSRDDTRAQLIAMQPQYPFLHPAFIDVNRGYGHGIHTGLLACRAPVLAWSHADQQTHPRDVFRAYDLWRSTPNHDKLLIKGVRHGRRWSECLITRGMEFSALLLLRRRLTEINAQPKLFARELLALASNPPDNFNFDVYMLYTALRHGWRIQSIPVHFPPRPHGSSNWSATFRSRLRTITQSFGYMARLGRGA